MKAKLLGLLLLTLVACHKREHTTVVVAAEERPVAIEVEIYDPTTNFVWENVAVRIVEAEVDGAGIGYANIIPDHWFFSDQNGLVYLDSFVFADAQIGFLINGAGQAVLEFAEGARVVLQVDALGFTSVFVEVLLSWDQPQVFVSVPFN